MSPALTVAIPSYNMEQWLPIAIESCLDQSDPDLEILVVDDGSKDRTPEITEFYKKVDSRVHVIRHDNMGLGATRQVGQDAAQGEYLTWLDADDFLDRHALRDMIGVARRDNVKMVCGNAVVFSDTTFNTRSYFHHPEISKTNFDNPDYWKSKVAWRWIFDTKFLRETPLLHPRYALGQDCVFMFAALCAVEKFSQCPSHFYYFRQDHKGSPSSMDVEVEHQLKHNLDVKRICLQHGHIKPLIKYLQENYYRDLGKLIPRTSGPEDPWAQRILEISLEVFCDLDPKWFTQSFLSPELKEVKAGLPMAEALIRGDELEIQDLFALWRAKGKSVKPVNKQSAFHTYRRLIKARFKPLSLKSRARLRSLESRAAKRLGKEWWK